ncbi:hypothetical protein Athai_50210 [Actinocatenispora thailandica]|uniref:Uncharacterized protein n=1 Tax=Actinocatenispora thailandica TaxID=227318 RepID=A0A7R7HYV4_9ACTN|nr:hypothetical protein Athai_50210 [Actinocatenispora thailandica]
MGPAEEIWHPNAREFRFVIEADAQHEVARPPASDPPIPRRPHETTPSGARGSFGMQLQRLHRRRESPKSRRLDDQHGAARILTVTDGDDAGEIARHFNALTAVAARSAGFAPPCLRQLCKEHSAAPSWHPDPRRA